ERCDGPAALRWSRTAAPVVDDLEVGSGFQARKARDGDRVCLIGVGKMVWTCLDAAEALAGEGIEATVWDPRVVKPLDPDMLGDAARVDHVITVEDGLREGGIGANIRQELADRSLGTDRNPRVTVLGTPTEYLPHGNPNTILSSLGLDAVGICEAVRR